MWQTIDSSFLAWAFIKCSNNMLTLELKLKLIFFGVEVVASLGSRLYFFFVGPLAQKIPNERHHMKIGTEWMERVKPL
jgi:hypothetical protein